jgi:zinc resistance-associated protein
MARPRHVAAILMATAFIACSACVLRQANAQGGPERGSAGQLDSDTDRLDSYAQGDRLSNVKQFLRLSPDQEKLWAPVEEALVNISEQRRAFRSELSGDDRADQIERLRRRAELATRRGEALKKLADAVQPLWATLSDEQKRELMWSLAMGPSRGDQDRQTGYRRDDGERFRRPYRYDNDDRVDRGWRDRDYSERRYRYPDGMRGYRNDDADDDDGMRGDRSDRSRWRSDDNDRPRWREFDRDRRDFDGRSGRDNCRCNRFD